MRQAGQWPRRTATDLTAVKGVGGAIAGAAGAVGDGVSGLFKPKKHGRHAAGGPQRELEAQRTRDVTEE